jgi:hypothetical protein
MDGGLSLSEVLFKLAKQAAKERWLMLSGRCWMPYSPWYGCSNFAEVT